MKAKALHWTHHDYSGSGVERIYLEKDFEQAEKDISMLKDHSDKVWILLDVDVYNSYTNIPNGYFNKDK